MRRALLALAVTLALVVPVGADTQRGPFGTLDTLTAGDIRRTTGSVFADGATSLCFLIIQAGTGTASLDQSLDGGTTWVTVQSGVATSTSTATNTMCIPNPLGLYSVNVTANSTTTTIKWRMSGKSA